MSQKNSY